MCKTHVSGQITYVDDLVTQLLTVGHVIYPCVENAQPISVHRWDELREWARRRMRTDGHKLSAPFPIHSEEDKTHHITDANINADVKIHLRRAELTIMPRVFIPVEVGDYELIVRLTPGEHVFICPIHPHRQARMYTAPKENMPDPPPGWWKYMVEVTLCRKRAP